MERRVTPPRRVTSPTWGPPPPCKQALNGYVNVCLHVVVSINKQYYQPVRDEQDLVLESNSQREGRPYAQKAGGVKNSPVHS